MTVGHGNDFLVKVGDGGAPEVFSTIGGMKTNGLSINNEMIDVTNKDSAAWKQLIAGGIKSLSISGSGIMQDVATVKALMAAIMSTTGGDVKNFKLVSGLGYSFTGSFFIASLEIGGDVGKEEHFTIKLDSAAAPTFSPIP